MRLNWTVSNPLANGAGTVEALVWLLLDSSLYDIVGSKWLIEIIVRLFKEHVYELTFSSVQVLLFIY